MKKLKLPHINHQRIAVAYLLRGVDTDWQLSCERFINSYKRNSSGLSHSLYILFKGFFDQSELENAKAFFTEEAYTPILLGDDRFDIGAYIEWANMIEENVICVFNTASEILAPDWLWKLAVNLAIPDVRLVGATGSYESLSGLHSAFPIFPNPHIRSTAFMTYRRLFCQFTKELEIVDKIDAYSFESGINSLTRYVFDMHKQALVVGRNGRGYLPDSWALSDTFRQGIQNNLLVADNQTRNYLALPWNDKRHFVDLTWGKHIGRWVNLV